MKRLTIIFVTLVAIVCCTVLLPTRAQAATEGYYTYTVSNSEATIMDCDESIGGGVMIPATLGGYPVTSIGEHVFWNCPNITSITIPNGVTDIGDHNFRYCSSLTSITISSSVINIGEYVFCDLPNLAGIQVDSDNLMYSSDEHGVLFNKDKTELVRVPCTMTGSYTIPNTVICVGNQAFWDCSKLTSIDIPNSVTSIGNNAFTYCSGLASIDIPNGVVNIGESAFARCTSLTSISIPESITSIEAWTFQSCNNLTSITIPAGVASIGDFAFYECDSLAGIWVDSNNPAYSSDSCGVLFNKDKTELIQAPYGITGAYTIPSSVTSIENIAFSRCFNLTSIVIPNGITTLNDETFKSCHQLKSIQIPISIRAICFVPNIKHILYAGTQEQWNTVSGGGKNPANSDALVTYNYKDGVQYHLWDNGTVNEWPTYDKEGFKTYTCTVCYVTRTESVSKLPAVEPPTQTPTPAIPASTINPAPTELVCQPSASGPESKPIESQPDMTGPTTVTPATMGEQTDAQSKKIFPCGSIPIVVVAIGGVVAVGIIIWKKKH